MTDKEKLERCMQFIKQIQEFDDSRYDKFDIDDVVVDVDCSCNDCGSNDVDCDIEKSWPDGITLNDDYIEAKAIADIKDLAWHAWADIQS